MTMTQVVLNIFISASLILLVANSFSILYTTVKFFHLAHGAVITAGAYFVFYFSTRLSIPFLTAVPLAILSGALLGVLCEVFVYRQMRKKRRPALACLIASLGLYVVFQNCISLYFGSDAKVFRSGPVEAGHKVLGAHITTTQLITIEVSVLLFFMTGLFLRHTSAGRSIRAIACDQELGEIYGINSNKIIIIVFAIGSAMAATAGILAAIDTNMTPAFGFDLLLYGVVAMVVGGVGSTWSIVAGALLVSASRNFAGYYIDTKWMDAVTYVVLILFLIWKPLGFSGHRLKKINL